MSDTAMVPRNPDGQPPARRPLVDEQLADELLVLGVARDLRSAQSPGGPGEAIACQEDPMARWALAQLAVRHRASSIDLMARLNTS